MKYAITALLLLVACDKENPAESKPLSTTPPTGVAVDASSDIVDLPKADRLGGIICLRMDQLTVLKRGMKQVAGQSLGGLMVDGTVRQVEEYDKTGKWPSETKIEKKLNEQDKFDRLMNISEITGAVQCFDEKVDECIKSGGSGKLCFNMSKEACKKHNLKLAKSHCEKLEE